MKVIHFHMQGAKVTAQEYKVAKHDEVKNKYGPIIGLMFFFFHKRSIAI